MRAPLAALNGSIETLELRLHCWLSLMWLGACQIAKLLVCRHVQVLDLKNKEEVK